MYYFISGQFSVPLFYFFSLFLTRSALVLLDVDAVHIIKQYFSRNPIHMQSRNLEVCSVCVCVSFCLNSLTILA